jgi:YbgC/YbaW family acyl-CoA thioester hydrolase
MSAYRYLFKIPFHEVDAAGVIFHAHLFSHAHDAYNALMRELGHDLKTLLQEGRCLVPLVHAEADFHLPMELDDEIEIRIHALPPGNSSIGFRYHFLKDELLCASVTTRHVFIDRKQHNRLPLPPGLREALQAFCD